MEDSEDFLRWWKNHEGIHNLSRYEVGEAVWMSIIHRLKLAEGERDSYLELYREADNKWNKD